MSGKYHLTARPNRHARNKVWYAWWWEQDARGQIIYDEAGNRKRVYKSTGCSRKSDALKVLAEWEEQDKHKLSGTLREFAEDMFIRGKCPYLAWKPHLKDQTVYQHRNHLSRILERFGDYNISEIYEIEVEEWLRNINNNKRKAQRSLSNSAKNEILNTFNIVLTEARRARLISEVPKFRRFRRQSTRPDILTEDDLATLFPSDELELAKIWGDLGSGLMFLVTLQAGMRPGEGRALHAEQVFPEYNTILIDRQLDSYNKLSTLKKATNEDKRIRFSRIPKTTMDLLQRYMQLNSITNGFLFTFEGEPWTDEHHRWTFKKALERAGVERGKRKLVPYSLRFTFRSRAHGFLEMQHIMEMMGHRSEEMSLHYLRINPEQFKAFEQYQATIDRMWEYEGKEENEEVDRHEEQ